MLAKGIQVPPIIHLSQFYYDGGKGTGCVLEIPKHIARCITLCKMWAGQAEESGQIVQDAVRREVECILTKVCVIFTCQYRLFYNGPVDQFCSRSELLSLSITLIFPHLVPRFDHTFTGQRRDDQTTHRVRIGAYDSLHIQYRSFDAPTLLAALQSLTILLVLLIFPCNRQKTLSIVPDHLFVAVQEMSDHVLSTGMLLHEEADHVRPHWRIWTHIEAKRRTLVCIFLVQFAYSSCQGRIHFSCVQLGRMRAPGPKWLWQAADEKRWTNLYARWLAQWNGKEIIQAELFLVEHGPVMDPRVEMWLEDADELSILMMSISEQFLSPVSSRGVLPGGRDC